ncbi:N-acetylmuramoyl-L-alanine amidase [Conchiformibius kuhniae]|uniref:N-acetylmuramoyl-L-alanine amidase n=1 Tax=Conchiformibius kuhniae TaxID=211502 RepID=A0ABD8B6U9_9NEIS|nr:N-acetylmuramoyl-L-alanine amidase [Conchiformibius kuhniae]
MKKWFKRAAFAAVCALHLGSAAAADVVIDAGHGGKDHGALGTLGKHQYMEKDFALDMSLQLRKHLRQQGFSVAMTRTDDTFRPLGQRLAYGRKHCRKLFASVHVNAAKNNPRANGVHTYVLQGNDATAVGKKSLQIARNVQKAFNPKRPEVRRARFVTLQNTTCPSVQLEMYFMSNKADLKKLADKRQRRAIAGKLAKVIGTSLKQRDAKAKAKPAPSAVKPQTSKPAAKPSRPRVPAKAAAKDKPAPLKKAAPKTAAKPKAKR